LRGRFTAAGEERVAVELSLTRAEAATLVEMTPSARHVTAEELRSGLARMPEPVAVTAAFRLSVYRRR